MKLEHQYYFLVGASFRIRRHLLQSPPLYNKNYIPDYRWLNKKFPRTYYHKFVIKKHFLVYFTHSEREQ